MIKQGDGKSKLTRSRQIFLPGKRLSCSLSPDIHLTRHHHLVAAVRERCPGEFCFRNKVSKVDELVPVLGCDFMPALEISSQFFIPGEEFLSRKHIKIELVQRPCKALCPCNDMTVHFRDYFGELVGKRVGIHPG